MNKYILFSTKSISPYEVSKAKLNTEKQDLLLNVMRDILDNTNDCRVNIRIIIRDLPKEIKE
jgi:hypothetical protein